MVPRDFNDIVDSLATYATLLIPHKDFNQERYTIELVSRPSISDNWDHCQIFNDDNHIINFLEIKYNFNNIYFEGRKCSALDSSSDRESEQKEEILQLKCNKIPKGLVSLQKLFDKHDSKATTTRVVKQCHVI